jgi:hypothetical protein
MFHWLRDHRRKEILSKWGQSKIKRKIIFSRT